MPIGLLRPGEKAPPADPNAWQRNKRLEDVVIDGLKWTDTHELLVGMAEHVSQDGVWDLETISPSLVASSCRLQRVHKYLGHAAVPGPTNSLMQLREGQPDPVTQLNFLRGFCFEGVIVTALRRSPHLKVIASAPDFVPKAKWGGIDFSAHPDVYVGFEGPGPGINDAWLELIQVKCPSWWALDGLHRFPERLREHYNLQIQCEMLVCRMAGYPVSGSNLLIGTWEGTPAASSPSIECYNVPYEPETANKVIEIAKEIRHDADRFKARGVLPEAIPFKYRRPAIFPCGYCKYSRVANGPLGIPGCEQVGR